MMYSVAPIVGLDDGNVEYTQLEYTGVDILAYKSEVGYVVERVFSTNPQDYLRPDLQPGVILENSLIKLV